MPTEGIPARKMTAFKIGARAHKFAREGCPIEGYDYLYAALRAAEEKDPELHGYLLTELDKYEVRLEALEAEESDADQPHP